MAILGGYLNSKKEPPPGHQKQREGSTRKAVPWQTCERVIRMKETSDLCKRVCSELCANGGPQPQLARGSRRPASATLVRPRKRGSHPLAQRRIGPCYHKHMKRTNLVLDEALLEEAVRVLGTKTYSATVNLALKEALRMKRIQGLADHIGKVEWLGDISAMRADSGR